MAIYWNHNYCVEFLDEMICFCDKQDNFLAQIHSILLSSIEIVAMEILWSIFHLAIIMLMRWLSVDTHIQMVHNWDYISLGKVLDKLKDDLEST